MHRMVLIEKVKRKRTVTKKTKTFKNVDVRTGIYLMTSRTIRI